MHSQNPNRKLVQNLLYQWATQQDPKASLAAPKVPHNFHTYHQTCTVQLAPLRHGNLAWPQTNTLLDSSFPTEIETDVAERSLLGKRSDDNLQTAITEFRTNKGSWGLFLMNPSLHACFNNLTTPKDDGQNAISLTTSGPRMKAKSDLTQRF